MLNVMQNGFSAVTFSAVEFNVTAYQGMVIYQATEQNGGIAIQYPAFNAGIWTPTLVHAPSGVTGALWSVLQLSIDQPIPYGVPISHDGTGWQGVLASSQLFTHISAGSDGTVFGVVMTGTNAYALAQLQADGSTWTNLAGLPVPPAHLSAGDANHVWLLGTDNKVYRYAAGGFTQVASIDMATHIAANPDGTVWHAKGDPYAYRFISEGTAAATQLEIANGNAISKVASAGFATAYVLADNTTLQAQADVQAAAAYATTALYAYDSIYVWKTVADLYSDVGQPICLLWPGPRRQQCLSRGARSQLCRRKFLSCCARRPNGVGGVAEPFRHSEFDGVCLRRDCLRRNLQLHLLRFRQCHLCRGRCNGAAGLAVHGGGDGRLHRFPISATAP